MTETTAPAIDVYQRAALEREERRRRALAERLRRAETVARSAAQVLKEQFGATAVILFGSVAHGMGFHADSDIDLAAAGIAPADFWRAWAALDAIDLSFEINLIAVEEATALLKTILETEGLTL
jgi:predicted nucleotidyltransferase